jgi:hypothetical protein
VSNSILRNCSFLIKILHSKHSNFFFEWNSKFRSFFGKKLFFLIIRCNKDHASQISSKSKVLEIVSEFLSKFNS